MVLYLVRHTKVNTLEGICYGQSDVGLAPSFNEEAKVIIKNLANVKIDEFYASPLLRCKTLAEVLRLKLNFPEITYLNELKELNFGDWEGQFWNQIDKTTEAKEWFDNWVNVKTPNGESYEQLAVRVNSFLEMLKSNPSGKTILLVTHGGVIRAVNALLNNLELQKAFDLKVAYGQILKLNIS